MVEVKDVVFDACLGDGSKDEKTSRSLSHAITRLAVGRALEMEPLLTERGFDSTLPQTRSEREMTFERRRTDPKKRHGVAHSDRCGIDVP